MHRRSCHGAPPTDEFAAPVGSHRHDCRRARDRPGTDVWPRTSPEGRPAAYVTRDAGASWARQDQGLPGQGWFTVKRQAMTTDDGDPVGVYFGTTSGEVWASNDEGASWTSILAHLPEIYSVESGRPAG
jgi:hypothetical protein